MQENFLDTDSFLEIDSIMRFSRPETTIVWQNVNGKRIIYGVYDIIYNESLQTLQLHIRDYHFNLLVEETMYVKLSHRDALFKGHVINIQANILTIYIPKIVKALELREFQRTNFKPSDDKKATLRVAYKEDSTQSTELLFKVLNISPGGICLIVSENNKAYLKNNYSHNLIYLNGVQLKEELALELKYMQRHRYRIRGELHTGQRVGFKFSKAIDMSMLNIFVNKD